jgi:hypothetical protein
LSDTKPTPIDAQQMNPGATGWTTQSQAQLVLATSTGYDVEAPAGGRVKAMATIKSDDLFMPRRNYNLPSAVVPRRAKDPSAEDQIEIQKPGSRTMKVRKGTGLPAPQKIHTHHVRSSKRPQRAR